ncbi:hypothetical protein BD779DRAFT_1795653 [Infundibulicybe gibba]|nr:hypothetical protein BD779DRAFT_1795653 [Infundibulicybe gibba]
MFRRVLPLVVASVTGVVSGIYIFRPLILDAIPAQLRQGLSELKDTPQQQEGNIGGSDL